MWLLMTMKRPSHSLEKQRCKFSRNVRLVIAFRSSPFLSQKECGIYSAKNVTSFLVFIGMVMYLNVKLLPQI